ncbi:MAG: hypothetical protein ABS948_18100 [Solibacillus sp.]
MSQKTKILLLVEGEKTEKELFSHLYEIYGINDVEIISYKTHIYAFYHRLFNDYSVDGVIDFDFIDIPLFLNDYFSLEGEEILNESDFRDIILIFDFDPHDPSYDADKLEILVENFNESTDKGKLYINYPMIESYKDITSLEDGSFNNSEVTLEDLKKRSRGTSYYKRLVDSRTCITDIQLLDGEKIKDIILVHQKKLEYILGDKYEEFEKYKSLCNLQCEKVSNDNSLWILNTSILHMLEQYGV